MGKIEDLSANYGHHVSAPWQKTIPGAQRVLMVVYDKEWERTLRARMGLFEQATRQARHGWNLVDCTKWFSEWMSADEYREEYFESPDLLEMKLRGEFRPHVASRLAQRLEEADEDTVVALMGTASLYGFVHLSDVIHDVEQSIRGRLLVFFPGVKTENNYRLLDARDGWNYLANSITHHSKVDI